MTLLLFLLVSMLLTANVNARDVKHFDRRAREIRMERHMAHCERCGKAIEFRKAKEAHLRHMKMMHKGEFCKCHKGDFRKGDFCKGRGGDCRKGEFRKGRKGDFRKGDFRKDDKRAERR